MNYNVHLRKREREMIVSALSALFVCGALFFLVIFGKSVRADANARKAAEKQQRHQNTSTVSDSLESRNIHNYWEWDGQLTERHFASDTTLSIDGPLVVRWVLCSDSVPFAYPLEKGEDGNYIVRENYHAVPTICGWKEKGMFLSCPDQFGQRGYFKEAWLTKDFWRTDQWRSALKANDISDGNYFLIDALKLNILATPGIVETELRSVKALVENTVPFPISLDTLTGEEIKKVLVLFTATMQEKSTN